jgi:hypothetical protein
MSSTKIAVAITAIVFTATAGVYSTIVFQQIVDAVNQRMPQHQNDSLWWSWLKYRRVIAEYRRLYPDRTLEGKYRISVAAAFVSLFALAWAIGIFSP